MRILSTTLIMLLISTIAFAEELNQTEVWHAPSTYSGDDIVEREERLSNLYEELEQNPDGKRRAELYTLLAEAYRDLLTHGPGTYSIDDEFRRERRLAPIYDELKQNPSPKREAELLYQEAILMLETPEEMYSLKIATSNLLYAIELDPYNWVYDEDLRGVYGEHWKDRDVSGDDEVSRSLQAIKHKARIIVGEEEKKLMTDLGLVYIGMPKEDLYKTGFTEYLQKDYRKEGNEEWITFSDWTTEESGDLITFHLVDGKVEGWERSRPKHEKEKTRQSEI